MLKGFLLLLTLFILLITSVRADVIIGTDGLGIFEIFGQVTELFSDSKGLSYQYKIATALFLIVGLFKNSMMKPLWDKLGKFKPLVAPLLSLIAFLFMVQPFTFSTFVAAITTGAAAGYFSQVLDALKTFPKIGYVAAVISDVVGKVFKRPQV
jgi:hypothetical protein